MQTGSLSGLQLEQVPLTLAAYAVQGAFASLELVSKPVQATILLRPVNGSVPGQSCNAR